MAVKKKVGKKRTTKSRDKVVASRSGAEVWKTAEAFSADNSVGDVGFFLECCTIVSSGASYVRVLNRCRTCKVVFVDWNRPNLPIEEHRIPGKRTIKLKWKSTHCSLRGEYDCE